MPKAKPKKRKPASRKPGAQPGNKNAEKHGFYAKRFNFDETKRLEGTERLSIESEIDLLRVCLDRLTSELDFDAVYLMGKDENGAPIQTQQRDSHYLQQLNTLSLMAQSLATLARTHYLTRGKGGTVETSILEALEELRLEMGI
jgi:hypothetical protein